MDRLLAAPVGGRPRLLALDGRSGSGKTRLAEGVRAEVEGRGLGCAVVHLDLLYQGWDGLAAALPVLCADVAAPLRAGRAAAYRSWDWLASSPGPVQEVPATDVVVVEGVGALAAPCDPWDLRVWLESPTELRRRRALDRDGDTFAPHWDRWAAQEEAVLGPVGTRPEADLVLEVRP